MSEFLFHTYFLNRTPQKSGSVPSPPGSLYYYFPLPMSNSFNQSQYYYHLLRESKKIDFVDDPVTQNLWASSIYEYYLNPIRLRSIFFPKGLCPSGGISSGAPCHPENLGKCFPQSSFNYSKAFYTLLYFKKIRPFKKIFACRTEPRSKKNIDKQISIKIQLN